MVHAIRIHQQGGPETLKWEQVELGKPGAGEVRIRHTAIGLNYVDTYLRSGLYPMPLPSGLGGEGAGIVEEIGAGVGDLKVGDRVAYGSAPLGAYSEARLIPAERLVKIPDGIADETAAAMMLKGLTTEYLVNRSYAITAGDTVLFHAAAGGVGLIFGQWAKAKGATLIGTVGSADKAKLARDHGYDHIIEYRHEDFVARVGEITKGAKVRAVYDGVGKDTFMKSLDCVRPHGIIVSFGQASGKIPPFDAGILATKGSLYLQRPTLATYTARRDDLVAMAKNLFDIVLAGKVRIEVNQTYPLKDAARAHADLEGRKTTGSSVLLP
jgi:NADPH2:quinone reductase